MNIWIYFYMNIWIYSYKAVCEASVGIWWDWYHGQLRLITNERFAAFTGLARPYIYGAVKKRKRRTRQEGVRPPDGSY